MNAIQIAIQIRGVTKSFTGVIAVNDLSLDIPQGSIYGFIGPNGSGKTTTMRMIVGISHPIAEAFRSSARRCPRPAPPVSPATCPKSAVSIGK